MARHNLVDQRLPLALNSSCNERKECKHLVAVVLGGRWCIFLLGFLSVFFGGRELQLLLLCFSLHPSCSPYNKVGSSSWTLWRVDNCFSETLRNSRRLPYTHVRTVVRHVAVEDRMFCTSLLKLQKNVCCFAYKN